MRKMPTSVLMLLYNELAIHGIIIIDELCDDHVDSDDSGEEEEGN
jgi:hypothetical protein